MPETAASDQIVPVDYPELCRLAWNRDVHRPMSAAAAFDLYETAWRHVDQAALGQAERALIDTLARRFGNGHLLTTR